MGQCMIVDMPLLLPPAALAFWASFAFVSFALDAAAAAAADAFAFDVAAASATFVVDLEAAWLAFSVSAKLMLLFP